MRTPRLILMVAVVTAAVFLTILPCISSGQNAYAERPYRRPASKPYRQVQSSPTTFETQPTMTAPQALRKIREGLQNGKIRVVRGAVFGCVGYRRFENINVTFTELSFTEVEKCENSMYNSPPESHSYQFNKLSDRQSIDELADTLGFVDAVNAIKYYSSGSDVADDVPIFAKFQEEARAWRQQSVKPPLPEEVRRFRVLAEDAFQSKDFEKAVGYYEKGLAIEPMWPVGQFNAAIIYGELKLYSMAVIHMKRYLELNPDAKDAKAYRDQMYIWEEKANEADASSQSNLDRFVQF